MSTGAILSVALLTLAAIFFLSTLLGSLRTLRSRGPINLKVMGPLFFYRNIQGALLRGKEVDLLLLAIACAQNVLRLSYGCLATMALVASPWTSPVETGIFAALVLVSLVLGDIVPRGWSMHYPDAALKVVSPVTAVILTLCLPVTLPFLWISGRWGSSAAGDSGNEGIDPVREQLMELIQDADHATMEPQEKKMIESMVTFRDRIAREVMVPRVNMFSLASDATIKEAASVLQEEGYSRVPVYRQKIDEIIGVLMYKDLMAKYMEYEETDNHAVIDAPIETIVKPVMYAPETKKISNLLQDFRNKQMHIAIVVDEYGGTEGIVTIEDILEEVVGEIEDEYDEEESLFQPIPSGGWIVDARMSIIDIEEELGVKIPQDGDYDTVGGYLFHRSGSIPEEGFVIEHDDFSMRILSSNERCVEKVRLTPPESDGNE